VVLWALLQLGAGLATLQTPPDVLGRLSAIVLGVLSLAWAVLLGFLAVGLLRARLLAWIVSVWTLLAFALYQIARQLLLTRADYEGARWPFLLTVNLLLVGMALVILGWHYIHRSNPNGD
jgi:hypothetical protein